MLRTLSLAVLAAAALSACRDSDQTLATAPTSPLLKKRGDDNSATVALVRQLTASRGITALPKAPYVRGELVKLGQMLAFDPILSGNENISCMTCHMPAYATGDDKSLSVGEGGNGFGPTREHAGNAFIARNAPPVFNMAAMRHLFWDGRVQLDEHGAIQTPAGNQVTPAMEKVFEFGPISAIAMFPPTNRFEMRGQLGTNEVAAVDDADNPGIWAALMKRLGAIPEYRTLFENAYPGTKFDDMTFAHASNAIGGFIVEKLTFENSPWDRFLAGDNHALSQEQLEGAQTFMTLKCSTCHSGATLSDERFHNVAVPQIGPGEGDGAGGRDDFGRMRVTGLADDRYRFRTSPLRNVELTAPYGHDGAITSLRAFVEHYSESDLKIASFDPMQLETNLRGTVQGNSAAILAQRDTLLQGVILSSDQVDKLMDYMSALTDDAARDLKHLVPNKVPSGLTVIPRKP
jgi:cytochrome c peroxidase